VEVLDPQHLALQAPDLAQVDHDADRQHEQDHPVEGGVRAEGVLERREQGHTGHPIRARNPSIQTRTRWGWLMRGSVRESCDAARSIAHPT
jgi:hypothetical protein